MRRLGADEPPEPPPASSASWRVADQNLDQLPPVVAPKISLRVVWIHAFTVAAVALTFSYYIYKMKFIPVPAPIRMKMATESGHMEVGLGSCVLYGAPR